MRGRSLVGGICLLVIALAARPAASQIDPALETDILRLLGTLSDEEVMAERLNAVLDDMTEALRLQWPAVSRRAADIARDVVREQVAAGMRGPDEAISRLVPLYAKHFSHEDIRGMIAFFETDTGRRMLRVMPSLEREAVRDVHERVLQRASQIRAEVERRFRAAGLVVPSGTSTGTEPKGPFERLFDRKLTGTLNANQQPPQLLREVKPRYTPAARAKGVEGNVILECIVQVDGGVEGCKVVQSLDPELDQEAIKAASQWRFVPGKQDGRPAAVVITVELGFNLRGFQPVSGTPASIPAGATDPPAAPAPPPPAPPRFEKGQKYVLDGKIGFAPARLAFEYRGDGEFTADLTVEGNYGLRQPIRLTGSLVGVDLRLSSGEVKLEGRFNGATVTGSYQLGATTGGTFSLSRR